MAQLDGFDFGAVDEGFFTNPYPAYRELRDMPGPCRQPDGSYFVSRYDDVAAILADHETYISDKTIDFKPRFGDGPLYEHHTTSLVFNDPPRHTRVRRLLTPFFTPRTLRALEPNVAAMIDELVDAAEDKETIDLVADFAIAIPLTLIGDMLGIPRGEREPLRAWATIILGALEPALTAEQLAVGNRAVEDFKAYLKDLIAWKRDRLAEREDTDILSALLADHDTADGLTEIELMHNCIFLLNAGHDTTAMLISNGLDLLFRFPDQMARLRADPALMKTAIEEMLRYESPLQVGNRRTTTEVTVHGETLPPGTFLHVGIASANHDERQFPEPDAFDIGRRPNRHLGFGNRRTTTEVTVHGETLRPGTFLHVGIASANHDERAFADPDDFDIGRRPNRHLGFGNGIHTCAGNSLARMEASLAFSKLLERFKIIERTGPTVRPPRARFRVVSELPVRLAV